MTPPGVVLVSLTKFLRPQNRVVVTPIESISFKHVPSHPFRIFLFRKTGGDGAIIFSLLPHLVTSPLSHCFLPVCPPPINMLGSPLQKSHGSAVAAPVALTFSPFSFPAARTARSVYLEGKKLPVRGGTSFSQSPVYGKSARRKSLLRTTDVKALKEEIQSCPPPRPLQNRKRTCRDQTRPLARLRRRFHVLRPGHPQTRRPPATNTLTSFQTFKP